MSALGFPLSAALARIAGIERVALVGVAPDLDAAMNAAPRTAPAIFMLSETSGGAIKYSGPPIQQGRKTSIKCIAWVRNHGAADKVRAEMDALLADMDARFAGWSPGDAFGAMRFVASRDEFAHAQYLVVQSIYESEWDFFAMKQP